MTIASEDVLRITGTFIEDADAPKPAILSWIQSECRHGCFQPVVESFAKSQPESLRADLVLVEKAEGDRITMRIPGNVADHEAASPFEVEVTVEFNPVTLAMKRTGV